MFGAYRTILAIMVVAYHLLFIPAIGAYAVHGFFILSGYLMTAVLHDRYGYGFKNFSRFATNRILRLYPLNLIILLLTIVVILFIGEEHTVLYHDRIFMPENLLEIFRALTMVYLDSGLLPNTVEPCPIPTTWAITHEIIFYILIGVGLSYSKKITFLWFVASILMTTSMVYINETWNDFTLYDIYFPIFTASLPFSIGAMIYHNRESIPEYVLSKKTCLVLVFLFFFYLLNAVFSALAMKMFEADAITLFCFYLNLIVQAVIVGLLARLKISDSVRKFDNEAGHYSYPFYLLHFLCGLIISAAFFDLAPPGRNLTSLMVFISAFILMVGISWILIQFVDKPINQFRKKFRKKEGAGPDN